MAIDQDLLDDVASSVADLYRELETALNQRIAQRLRADLDSPYELGKLDAVQKLRRSAQLLLATLQADRTKAIRDAIATAYRDGYGSALTGIPERYWPKSGIGQQAREAQREIPNSPLIENLAQALHRDLGRVEANILRNVADAYRAVQAAAAARIVSGAFTRRQAAQAAWQRLVDRGVTSFVDSAGRRWKLSSYAEMMTRTNAQRAAVQGQTDRLTSIGVDLVIVSDHTQECKLCRPFEGKVLTLGSETGRIEVQHATRDGETVTVNVVATLDQARAAGLMHPNCRHSTSAYLPGVTKQPTNTADPDGDKARQRQREIERNIRKYKERANSALTDEAKRAANARVREWQREMRDHLAANPKLKRLRYREQPGAGNTPPKGGQSPGGPAGDLQPPVQPTLDGGPGARLPRRDLDSKDDVQSARPGDDQPELPFDESPDPTSDQYRQMGDDDLKAWFDYWIEQADDAQIERVAAEMARRDDELHQAQKQGQDGGSWGQWQDVEVTDEDRRVDELVDAGWDYVDAYAEVYGLDAERLRAEERRARLESERRPGESLDQLASRLYRDWVHTQWLQAENDTNGVLLNKLGEAEGIDPVSLFSGPTSRAKKYASEELRRWWNDHPRMTLTEFRAQLLGRDRDRQASRTTREIGGAGI